MYKRIDWIDEDAQRRLKEYLSDVKFVRVQSAAVGGDFENPADYWTTGKLDVTLLKKYIDTDLVNAIAVRIKPGGRLHEHTHDLERDQGKVRFHIVVETNDECECWNGEVAYKLEERGIYSMQPFLPHKAYNRGQSDRTHIILVTYGEYRNH